MAGRLKQELAFGIALIAALAAYFLEHSGTHLSQTVNLIAAAVLIAAIVGVSIRVAHHAEAIAAKVGDPYGTMILTLSAVVVEVVILAIMMSAESSPTLARDTIYSAVMLDINGILGLAALLGGLKHGEQAYNDDSGKTYSVMILTAMGISMVVPEFVPQAKWHLYSGFTIVAMLSLYALFLRMQVDQHSYFFSYHYPRNTRKAEAAAVAAEGDHDEDAPMSVSIAFLIAGVCVIGLLAELMSGFMTEGLKGTGTPPAVAAIIVAGISAAPEILTALRAALANRMQSVINIALGASLSTVILTVPVMEALALFQGEPIVMAMTSTQTVMVTITLIASAINLSDGETNAIEGMTHFVLFATFLMLSAIGL
ncbi:calcium:proton antiporter [Rhizobium sp. NRK18]|uniref:calcium:proton antiporter n=1 Tax=Rhizobium sp. NRK18 TaxID=2964667 RepID=UPI0021C2A22C|nr:calcium:proton antiporter [Rhizobium sp. NRK18]MCQ2003639.1 calcium:proton antiporter [Rhizobium sp. NRK18]